MDVQVWIALVGIVVGVGGIGGAVVAFVRTPREAGQIVVESAKVVVELATAQLQEVERRAEEREAELLAKIRALEDRLAEVIRTSPSPDDLHEVRQRNDELETQLATARSEVEVLRQRVAELEAREDARDIDAQGGT